MVQMLRMSPMVLVMGGLFVLSSQPGSSLVLPPIVGVDKVAHVLAYGVLAVAVLFSLPAKIRIDLPTTAVAVVLVVSILYGVTDEFHQSFVPGRQAGFDDLLADGIGATLVSGVWLWWKGKSPHLQ